MPTVCYLEKKNNEELRSSVKNRYVTVSTYQLELRKAVSRKKKLMKIERGRTTIEKNS